MEKDLVSTVDGLWIQTTNSSKHLSFAFAMSRCNIKKEERKKKIYFAVSSTIFLSKLSADFWVLNFFVNNLCLLHEFSI